MERSRMEGEEYNTPCLLLDLSEVTKRYEDLRRSFGERTEIFYSVKANNHPVVLRHLTELGSCFDVASGKEIDAVMASGAGPERIAFSNPVKIPADIMKAHAAGIRLYAFDSETEIEKLSKLAPGCRVYVRLVVSNEGSIWPLTKKFGVGHHRAVELLRKSRDAGLEPYGVTFHVGSQCLNPAAWSAALRVADDVFRGCEKEGVDLKLLNMGGGLPAQDTATNPPSIDEIRDVVARELGNYFDDDVRVIIEPGRHLVATSGTLVANVVGLAERAGKDWVYLDVGVYNGLMEIYEDFPYEVRTDHPERPKRRYVMAGPTCDSVDVIFKDRELPELKVGDKLYFLNAGAYTMSYDLYNGFPFPEVEFHGR